MKMPRMSDWLVIAIILAVVIYLVAPHQIPVTLYKLSLVSLAAVAGYWADRSTFPYARPDIFWGKDVLFAAAMIRRAIIIAAFVVAVSLGA